MNEQHEQNLNLAQNIVNDYGKVLAEIQPSAYALRESFLPHDKDKIKSAIHLLLWELDGQDETICKSLAEAYVFLAQFVPDDEADIVVSGQVFMNSNNFDDEHLQLANQATKIINKIKLEMENLINDIKAFIT